MTNARTTIWVMAVVLSVASSPVLARVIHFRDGQAHGIDFPINHSVSVDYQAPGMQTIFNLLEGGSINGWLEAYENSEIIVLAGSIGMPLVAHDNSRVDISGGLITLTLQAQGSSQVSFSGGSIGDLVALDSSQVDISGGSIASWLAAFNGSQVSFSGGSIGHNLTAHDNSQVDISGGSIGINLVPSDAAIVTIHGSDFAVGGVPFGYGELTSILGGWWSDEPYRHLTGTLASGEPIDNGFYIGQDAKIVIGNYAKIVLDPGVIPAPSAILLGSIGVGFVGWLRTRRTL